MFAPPRFIVVDDNPKHLAGILDALRGLGTPGLGVIYDPERGLDGGHFRGVRVLFMDLHLIESGATTDEVRHYGTIASLLEDNVNPTGGPFILVIWTEHDQLIGELSSYLDNSLDPGKPYARPLAIMGLSKSRFIDLETGVPGEDRADALRDAVDGKLSEQPQLAALVAWEADVQAAAGETLSALLELVPEEARNSTSFAGGVDEVLTRLAREAVGQHNVATDPRVAITSALAPILADSIVNQEASDATTTVWRQAVSWQGQNQLDPTRAGKVNRMLHVAVPAFETILSTAWGAVVEFPRELWNDADLNELFGMTGSRLLRDEFKIDTEAHEQCRRRLIRIGAACDYARARPGPITYLFGVEIPPDNRRKSRPQSVWTSPTLQISPVDGPFVLLVNSRYPVSLPATGAATWNPVYRLREQVLMHLISHASGHMARPGIVQF